MSNTQNIGELVGQASTLFYNKKTKLLDGVFDEKQAQEIVDKIQALITEARIDELKAIMPPEQYKDYALLNGQDACRICGFNSEVFRDHLEDRLTQIKENK